MLRRLLRYLVLAVLLLVMVVSMFVLAVNFEFFGHLYSRKELKSFKNQTATRVFSSDQKLIGKFFAKNRTNVQYSDIPNHVIDALVSTEDARYFEHEGVDSRSLLRVLFKTLILNDSRSGGGSTITQQLVKNMYGRKRFGAITLLVNKTKEGILANRLESIYTKEEILALYLNTVPFGENVYGIESASRLFYNKSVSQLNMDEGAVLIGMLKANTYYNPRLYPDHAYGRRNVVFGQMLKYEKIDQVVHDSLVSLPIVLDYANLESEGPANYFLVQVKKELRQIIKDYNAKNGTELDYLSDGLRVVTTLDYQMQLMGKKSFKSHLPSMQKALRNQYKRGNSKRNLDKLVYAEIERKGLKDPNVIKAQEIFSWDSIYTDSISVLDSIRMSLTNLNAGLLALHPNSGAIKVWVGGIDYRTHPYDEVKARRQVASTFKPILYAAAIEKGIEPCNYISNSAKVFQDFDNWKPSNYDHSEGGSYSMKGALIRSKNIPSVNLYMETGFDEVDYLWRKLGFTYELNNSPSTALGVANANVLELAQAYASFANGGKKVNAYTIERVYSGTGELIYEATANPNGEMVMEEHTTYVMNDMLQEAINRGTGASIRGKYKVNFPLAGKTGTSQNFADAWFAAYNPKIVMVARVGASKPTIHFSNSQGSGGKLALPLVGETLMQMERNKSMTNQYNYAFPPVDSNLKYQMLCEDFIEDSAMDRFFDLFKSEETTVEKEEKKARNKTKKRKKNKKKKKRRLKDLFKKN